MAQPVPQSAATAGAAAQPYASASLYVGDLAPDVTEALLFETFNAVGPVASVRVCRDAATRRSLGYAYVNFHRVEDAERALDTMNFKPIRNRACRIMWSHRDPSLRKSGLGNIFVKNLAKSIDNKALYDTFSIFGNILSCKVSTNGKGESLGYGFVHYETEESAAQAIARVNGKVIADSQVSVAAFKSKKERGGNKYKYTNTFVKNLAVDTTKEDLEALFSKYGQVTSCVVYLPSEEKGGPDKRGYGFVNFNTPEEATAAVEGLNGTEYRGNKLYVGRAQKKEERGRELRERFDLLKMERQKKWVGTNLYVKNLNDDIDDARLSAEFSKFGSITSAKVMVEGGKSRGFGFVCFSSPEEATKAVSEMNGHMLDGKPLYVALAQNKAAREQFLNQQHAARQKIGAQQPMYPAHMGGAPMFYPNMRGPPMMPGMYPPQGMMPRPWQGQPRGPPQMGMVRQPMPGVTAYQLMPATAVGGRGGPMGPMGGGMRGGRGQGQRGGRGPRMQNGPGGPGGPAVGGRGGPPPQQRPGQGPIPGPQQAGNVRYGENVRNRDQRGPVQGQVGQVPLDASMPASQAPQLTAPLTIKELAAAPEEQKKQMIGERLYILIKQQQPELAGKITGMLLEMDNGELIHLLESPAALNEKVNEAILVLQQHPEVDEAGEQAQ